MARLKNSTFKGARISDVDVDAPSFQRAVRDTAGDVALIFDKATGSNGETGAGHVITHDGVNGARLGMPLVNQLVMADIDLEAPSLKDTDGGTGVTALWWAPIFLSAGEDSLDVALFASSVAVEARVIGLVAEIQDTSGNVVATGNLFEDEWDAAFGLTVYWTRGALKGLTGGALYLLLIHANTSDAGDLFFRFEALSVGPRLDGSRNVASPDPAALGDTNHGIFTPAASEGLAHRNFDASMFANLESIDGYTIAGLNQNLNGLDEYIRAWPAGDGASYVQRDDDSSGNPDATDPARVRFEAHSRALYANEGEIDFPLFCESLGAIMLDGTFVVNLLNPPTIGMLKWFAPWPRTTAEQVIREVVVNFPDFKSSVSRLKAAVLLGSSSASGVNNWTVKITTPAGSVSVTSGTGLAAIDGTNQIWLAQLSAIPFTGDSTGLVQLKLSRTGSTSTGEIAVIGWCLYFDP